jgi:hypothetical protein
VPLGPGFAKDLAFSDEVVRQGFGPDLACQRRIRAFSSWPMMTIGAAAEAALVGRIGWPKTPPNVIGGTNVEREVTQS